MILGFIGFVILAIVIGLYAYSSSRQYSNVPVHILKPFVSSFSLLAAASLCWAATFFVNNQAIQTLVLVADGLLLVATGCMISVMTNGLKPLILTSISMAGSALLVVRSTLIESTAYVSDGILFFDLSRTLAVGIGLGFLLVWLPAITKVVSIQTTQPKLSSLRMPMLFLFTSTILMTSFFLSAQRPVMIVATFMSVIVLFALLLLVNSLFAKLNTTHKRKVKHGR